MRWMNEGFYAQGFISMRFSMHMMFAWNGLRRCGSTWMVDRALAGADRGLFCVVA